MKEDREEGFRGEKSAGTTAKSEEKIDNWRSFYNTRAKRARLHPSRARSFAVYCTAVEIELA